MKIRFDVRAAGIYRAFAAFVLPRTGTMNFRPPEDMPFTLSKE
jgi:hypothetical protein